MELPEHSALRRRILRIQGDEKLDVQEKARLIQELMMNRSSSSLLARTPSISSVNSLQIEENVPQRRADGALGCTHYERGCLLYCECCKKWHLCHHCHNESEDHELERRTKVNKIKCMHCWKSQEPAQNCVHCGAKLGVYFCLSCRMWAEFEAFHCEECGICRRGERAHFRHCSRCACCISVGMFNSHQCLEGKLERDCPVCGEYMQTSTHQICFGWLCGHAMHSSCLSQQFHQGLYNCPLCQKSMQDMRYLHQQIDRYLCNEKMPEEYAGAIAHLLCNDCERKSTSSYHFIYNKCTECGSYNTRILKIGRQESDESDEEGVEVVSQLGSDVPE